MSQKEIDSIFRRAWRNKDVKSDLEELFDRNVSLNNMTVTYMRTLFVMGAPIDIDGNRYQNKTDNETTQDEYRKVYARKIKKIVDDSLAASYGQFGAKVRFASILLSLDVFFTYLIADLFFALVSVTFVFFYFIIHLKSKFLSTIGTSIILFSFPITVCITEGIG